MESKTLYKPSKYFFSGHARRKKPMRKCSHCGLNGHNSRTCDEKDCVKLFGVNIKRSLSLGDLDGYVTKSKPGHVDQYGYHSDEDHSGRERKKGKPWTEEEHRKFLSGLLKLGKGDWRGISRKFVPTRTPTQVASHAQKYFMRRQATAERKKRRSSVFDMTLPESASSSASSALKENGETQQQNNATGQIINQFPHLSLESRPVNSTMQSGLPYYITSPYVVRVPNWTTNYLTPHLPYVPYNNGGIGKLSPRAAVHPNPIFPKPPFPPSKRPNRLELEIKVGQAPPQSARSADSSQKTSGPIGVIS